MTFSFKTNRLLAAKKQLLKSMVKYCTRPGRTLKAKFAFNLKIIAFKI